jgi:hypothetical protein
MARLAVPALLLCALLAPAWPSIGSAEPPKTGRARAAAAAKKSRAKAKKEAKRASASEERAAPAREGRSANREAKEESAQPEGDGKVEARGSAREQSSDGKSDSKALSEAQKLARDAAQGANAQIVKEGDTSVKVMEFSGLDIEGRLKSPQLLYFVSRVHAEFDRPKLPHRSFMPELERSTKEDPIR